MPVDCLRESMKDSIVETINASCGIMDVTFSERDGTLIIQTSNGHMKIIPVNTNEVWIEIVK